MDSAGSPPLSPARPDPPVRALKDVRVPAVPAAFSPARRRLDLGTAVPAAPSPETRPSSLPVAVATVAENVEAPHWQAAPAKRIPLPAVLAAARIELPAAKKPAAKKPAASKKPAVPKPAKAKAPAPRKSRAKSPQTPGSQEAAPSLPDTPPTPATPERPTARQRATASGQSAAPKPAAPRKPAARRKRADPSPLPAAEPSLPLADRPFPAADLSSAPEDIPADAPPTDPPPDAPLVSSLFAPAEAPPPPVDPFFFPPVSAASPALPELPPAPPALVAPAPPAPASLRQIRDLKDIRVPRVPVAFAPARRKLPPVESRPGGFKPAGPAARPYRVPEPVSAPVVVLVPELPSTRTQARTALADRLGRPGAMVAFGLLFALTLLGWHDGARWLAAVRGWQWRSPHDSPNRFLRTAPDWYRQAQQRAAAGDFRLALGAVRYALALLPGDSVLLEFEGDMHQSLFEFRAAQDSYGQALLANPRNERARQSLALCRRLNRYRDDPASHRSTLYGLHRVMLGQQRTAEAVAISQRLGSDHALQQATWQAALDGTGLRGRITLRPDGALDLDLSGGPLQPDLSPLRNFPLTGLNLAGTGLEDLHALRGLPLERLNLADTPVYDLAPLRGLPLRTLNLHNTGVVELSALADCPLRELDISHTGVGDLAPLADLPLTILRASDTPVADLRPVAALPLTRLELARTNVTDLAPLGSLGLQVLTLDGTAVSDLAPLRSSPLRELSLPFTKVSDLSPLADMPLVSLALTGCLHPLDLRPLASCPELEHLTLPARVSNLPALSKLPHLHFVEHAAAVADARPSSPPVAASSVGGPRSPVPPLSGVPPAR